MNYQQTLDFLFSQLPVYQRVGAAAYKKDLNNTIALCKLLGNPEKKFDSIHVAGTNGKGSVSHFIASILQTAGYKTGLYTSPHLKDFRERIRINGNKISQQEVIEFVASNIAVFEEITPSFFEYTFAMAVSHFAKNNVDIVVMETGMGGRLDSTNVVKSILSVITNIGYDHTAFLGDTLEKIASEKAGIIKPEIPFIIGETQDDVAHVFQSRALEMNSKLTFADSEYQVEKVVESSDRPGVILNICKNGQEIIKELFCPLSGNYQLKNIVTTFRTIESLNDNGFNISKEDISTGIEDVIKNTGLMGRWQVLQKVPLTICDTGHNVDGIREVVEQLKTIKYTQLHFVLGLVNDKEIGKLLELLPKDARYYFCKADIPRGLSQEALKQLANDQGLKGESYNSVKQAYLAANKNASNDDLIFIGGSTFIVAEVI